MTTLKRIKSRMALKTRASRSMMANLLFCLFFLTFIFLCLAPNMLTMIGPGEGGVLFRPFSGGTVTTQTYGEGLHVTFPWNELYIYNIRKQERSLNIDVLTASGLTVNVGIKVFFMPKKEDLGLLHKEIGPNYVDIVLLPEVATSVRMTIGKHTPEELYTTIRGVIQQEIFLRSLIDISTKYIEIKNMVLTSLYLPDQVNQAIEKKLQEEQRFQEYEWRIAREKQEAFRKEIEAKGIHDYQEIVASALSKPFLTWQGIHSTLQLIRSKNAQVVVMSGSEEGLPVILNPMADKGTNDP